MAIERDKSIVATEIVDALSNTVGYGTGKKISDFPSGAPTSNDKILFEQNGEGKSTTIGNAVNTCSLSYEEIMASTDLSGKVASASVLKTLSDNLSGFSVLNSCHKYGEVFNIDNKANYPRGLGCLNFDFFSSESTGTKPFTDGYLLTFIWNNLEDSNNNYLTQVAFEDEGWVIVCRYYARTFWSDWKTVSIS